MTQTPRIASVCCHRMPGCCLKHRCRFRSSTPQRVAASRPPPLAAALQALTAKNGCPAAAANPHHRSGQRPSNHNSRLLSAPDVQEVASHDIYSSCWLISVGLKPLGAAKAAVSSYMSQALNNGAQACWQTLLAQIAEHDSSQHMHAPIRT